jgi:hypothetical protein
MGFQMPDLTGARQAIGRCVTEISSGYNDGFTARACKHDLFLLKSWLDDVYADLPQFQGEEQWQQQRTLDVLRRRER